MIVGPETRAEAVAAVLTALCRGTGLGWGVRVVGQTPDPFDPDEAEAMAHAVPARRAEFAAGRTAARDALRSIGSPAAAIPVGAGRAPKWPRGVAGSISHDGGIAIAVCGPSMLWAGIGIDLARRTPQAETDAALALAPEEVGQDALAVFSAKEAGFKAQFPATGAWLDYGAARLARGGAALRFTSAARAAGLPENWASRSLPVAQREAAGLIVTLCAVPPPGPPRPEPDLGAVAVTST